MARPRKDPRDVRIAISIRLHPTMYDWIQARVGPGKEFKDFTHAIERGIAALKMNENGTLRPHAPPAPEEAAAPRKAARRPAAKRAAPKK